MKQIKGNILAEGEATGHAHKLQHTPVYEESVMIRTFIVADQDSVTHEEHKPIQLSKNHYDSGQAREYDHFKEEARAVED